MKISPKTTILLGLCSRAKKTSHNPYRKRVLALVLAAALPLSVARADLPALGNSGANDGELAELGRQAIISASRRNPTLDDVELHAYLSSLLQTLRGANGLDDFDIDLTMFADRSVNAFALPGGYIGVFAGLVLNASTESALVSVLAHELAHLSQRHIHRFMERQSQASLAAMAAILAAALAMRDNPDAAQAAIYSGLATANQSLLDYSRAHEREADRTGQRLMSNAGFRPEGMAEMFEGLAVKEQLNQGQGLEYLQTHPVTQSRIADAWESARSFSQTGSDDNVAFALIQARVATLVGAPVTNSARPYSLALAALRDGNANKAQRALSKLAPDYRAHRLAVILRARILVALDEPDSSFALLGELQTNYPDWYPAFHTHAELLSDVGQFQEAADTLNSYLRKNGSHWPLTYRTLSIYYDQADDKMNALRWRAEHHAELRNYLAAASLFEQALQHSEENSATATRLQSRLDQIQERALQERPSE